MENESGFEILREPDGSWQNLTEYLSLLRQKGESSGFSFRPTLVTPEDVAYQDYLGVLNSIVKAKITQVSILDHRS